LRRAAIVTNATIGHNGGPELDDGRAIISIRTKWAKALFADPETPVYVMAIAWAIHWYSDASGSGAALSNEQLEVMCGISPRTATRGKAWLRDNGYVQLKVGLGTKTKFLLTVPHKMGVATQATLATEATPIKGSQPDGVANLTGSQSGEVATQARVGGSQSGEGGSQSGQGGVATQAALSSKDNQEDIQDKRAPARGRSKKSFWERAFTRDDHSDGVALEKGRLTLLNGTKSYWLEKFGTEDSLDLALIEISPLLQPNTQRPLQAQVEGRLAKIISERRDRDERYAKAVKANKGGAADQSKPSTEERLRQYLEEDQAKGGKSTWTR
jgi:hypothetical protein